MARLDDDTLKRIQHSRWCRGLPGYRGRGFRPRVQAAVVGDFDADTLESTRWKVDQRHVRMDRLTAALLVYHGANPAAVAICALTAGTAIVEIDELRVFSLTYKGAIAPAGPGLTWSSARSALMGPTLPEAAGVSLAGRPLALAVSHPALDPLGLVVDHVLRDEIVLADVGDADLMAYVPNTGGSPR